MAFVAQRIGMEFIGPFLFTGIRMLLGALTLLAVLLLSRLLRRDEDTGGDAGGDTKETVPFVSPPASPAPPAPTRPVLLKAGVLCGAILFIAGCLQQTGLVFTTASKAGFLTALYIVIVPILGIALRHKTHWNTWVSVLIAVLGLYLLCMTEGFSMQAGDLITLIGAFFWACHILVIDRYVGGLSRRDVMRLCIVQFLVAALLSMVAAVFFDRLFVPGGFSADAFLDALPALLYAGILSTGVAFTLQAIGQQGLAPSAASIIMSLEAVFSVLGGMLILGETLTGREMLGCAALFAAVILSQLPVTRTDKPANQPADQP
jgi:drug/metabolite transporter (DMT)-like permease